MAYSEKVIDHYNNPRNVGSFKKDDDGVGTGIVGAPECGDVMKLQIKVDRHIFANSQSRRLQLLLDYDNQAAAQNSGKPHPVHRTRLYRVWRQRGSYALSR